MRLCVITHKRIFKDFFTLRARKGQRSWLDAHNAVAVLTLPFQFMIAYTGIAISSLSFMPVGVWTVYGTDQAARTAFIADMTEAGPPAPSGKPMRSEEHTSELQSQSNLVCRLLLEKKKKYRAPACHTRNQRPNMHPQNLH